MIAGMTAAASPSDLHDVVSACLLEPKQNAWRLKDVATFIARAVGMNETYAVEVSKPGNLGKQLEQSGPARSARLAVAILEENSSFSAADYESVASTLIQSSATSVRTVAVTEKQNGDWRISLIVAAQGTPEADALRAFDTNARFLDAGVKARPTEAARRVGVTTGLQVKPLDTITGPNEPAAGASGPSSPAVVTLSGIPRRVEDILVRKGQVILYGPPGTGKTHYAFLTAREIVARRVYGRVFSDLTADEQRMVEGDATNGTLGLVRASTFHPEFGYEGFIEGYHPVLKDDRLAYERRNGIFKQLCDDARLDPAERPHVMIIDEINRGDIPRIFGELLTLLERDKRGRVVQLPLEGAMFSVPKNVFVIGTMNTADRSIALLDVALRRRFGFIALMPDYGVLGNTAVAGLPLARWLKWVNTRVRQAVGADGRHREIGHGYLWCNGGPVSDPGVLAAILRDDVVPLLEEYCFEDLARLEQILGAVVVDVDEQRVRYEVFDGDPKVAIASLMAAVPELADDASDTVAPLAADVLADAVDNVQTDDNDD